MFSGDEWLSLGAGGMNNRKEYYRNLAKNGTNPYEECLASGDRKNEKTPEQVRLSNAIYSPPQLDLSQLKSQSRHSPGKNFDRCFESEVEVVGTHISKHMVYDSFEYVFWQPVVLKNIKQCGYEVPTPIQKHAMPYVHGLRDVVGCAPTGSGKTAAYILPIMAHILQRGDVDWVLPDREHPAPAAIIMVPTRELAEQIKDEVRKYADGTKIKVVSVFGGTNIRYQVEYIRKNGCNILIGTPGRLLQLMREGRFRLCKVSWVVLDEAHRLLESMEEEPAVHQILLYPGLPEFGRCRFTLMFSATFPKSIRKLAEHFLHDPVYVTVGVGGGANEDIVQEILLVPGYEKCERLTALVKADLGASLPPGNQNITKTLIFVERKLVADFVASRLSGMGIPTTSIHGDREQREREEALRDFKTGRCPVLVATAVAARGLDIVHVAHVINFDLPQNIADYVHRIGRTGRVGNPGRATSFYDPKTDKQLSADLLTILRDAQQKVPDWLEAPDETR